jgi:ABC-type nitrate/sulfonate/bicarbonate transport system substrate-binding protein
MHRSAPRALLASLIVVASVLLSGPGGGAAPAAVVEAAAGPAREGPGPQPVRVRGGVVEAITNAGLYVAMDKGYFAEQGIDVDLGRFPGTDAYLASLATSELDFGTVDMNAGLLNALGRGIDLRLVADRGHTPPGQGYIGWIVRSDLANEIQDWGDLRGRRIGMSFEGSYQHLMGGRSIERAGLTLNDFELLSVAIPDANAALANRAIDATIGLEPFNTIGINNGWAVRWRGVDELVPDSQVVLLVFSSGFAGRRDVAERWMTAYLKGVRDYNTALRRGPNRQEIVEILTRLTPLKDPALWEQEPRATAPSGVMWPALDPDGRINVQSMQDDLDWFTSHGMVRAPVDLARYLDPSFTNAAVAQLGPYR